LGSGVTDHIPGSGGNGPLAWMELPQPWVQCHPNSTLPSLFILFLFGPNKPALNVVQCALGEDKVSVSRGRRISGSTVNRSFEKVNLKGVRVRGERSRSWEPEYLEVFHLIHQISSNLVFYRCENLNTCPTYLSDKNKCVQGIVLQLEGHQKLRGITLSFLSPLKELWSCWAGTFLATSISK
jgi:hypothetical protein